MSYEIKKILLPVDFSETSGIAVLEAILIAELFRAEICMVHVIEEKYYFPTAPDVMWNPEMIWVPPTPEDIDTLAKKKMEELKASVRSTISVQMHILHGNIPESITSYAEEHHADLIIMGTHGTSGYRELFLGSNAQRVVTLSKVPVLTLRKNGPSFEQILLPIDNSAHSREKVNIAVKIASAYKSKVHIIGLPDSDKQEDLNKFRIKTESVEKIIRAEQLSVKTTILHDGNLAEATLAYAKENKCDLLIINTGHESKMTGIFLGTFAQQIVNHSTIPVMSVRPHEDHYDITAPGYAV